MNQSITSSWPILFITDPKSLLSIRACIILFLALVFSLPLFSVLFSIFTPNTELWLHIRDNLLLDYVSNSFLLALGVGMGTLVLGVASAWLVTMCQFPGREWFSFLLILPMAIPAYIIAYTYTGIFDVAGPLQSWLRSTFGLLYGEYWFPDIRSLGGAITVMSLVLYPYVYLISRAALLEQSVCVLEVARTLGCGPWRVFFRVALPLIRPAIIVGLSLVLMETLADYGTVQYFGVPVFTTGIFRTWFGLDNLVGAAQLSAILLMFVFALVMIELLSRRQQRFTHTSQRYSSITPFSLSPLAASLAFTFCLLVLTLGFLLPVGFMIYWAMISFSLVVDEEFYSLLWNSLTLALVTALLAIGFAMLVSYIKRSQPSGLIHLVTRILGLGYALPGTIIAIGVMVPIASFDQSVNRFITEMLGIDSRIVLSGSLAVLIFAYLVRFLGSLYQYRRCSAVEGKTLHG